MAHEATGAVLVAASAGVRVFAHGLDRGRKSPHTRPQEPF